MNEELRQPSTHTIRQDRRMGNDKLEQDLEDWGLLRRKPMYGLDIPQKTSLKVAEELRPEQLTNKAPTLYYIDNKGRKKAHPAWYCRLVYELKMIWIKKNQRGTRNTIGFMPNYMPTRWYARLNQAIGQLDPLHYAIIVMRYEKEWDYKTANKEIGIPERTYYNRLSQAKKNLHKILTANGNKTNLNDRMY